MFSHRYRYLFILLISFYTFINTVLCNVYFYFDISIEWYYALLTIIGITLLTWEGNRLAEPLFKEGLHASKTRIRYLALFFLFGNVIALIAAFIPVYIVGNLLHGYTWKQNSNPLKLNIIYGSLINLFFHLLNAILFFFREYRRHWAEAEELRKVNMQAEVQLVKSQVNPHFLFNNLNVLSSMVIRNNPEANHFIEEFSKVYRYILNNQDKELVELRQELEVINAYVFLLKKRFNGALTVNIDVPEAYLNRHVVPAALQLLVENAIKHNVVSTKKPLHIEIHANGSQTISVKNNLQLRMITEPSTRIGLKNIMKRYELISGRNVEVLKTESTFEVTIPLLYLN